MCFYLIFGVHSPTTVFLFSFSFFFFFGLGFDPFNNGFYCTKFDFPFNSYSKYLDIMFVPEDK